VLVQYVVYILNVANEVCARKCMLLFIHSGTSSICIYVFTVNMYTDLPNVLQATQPHNNSARSFMPLKLPQSHNPARSQGETGAVAPLFPNCCTKSFQINQALNV